jgi:deazaflavin-dependent oxidoreductase (nitroreductase family)
MKRLIRFFRSLIVTFVAIGIITTAVVGTTFLIGMRTKSPTVQRSVRKVNKAFWNPRSLKTAGTPGAYASVVHHVGRSSGTSYETPVVPVRTDDGFVVTLPYGTQADWVRNVLDAGTATITHEGETYQVDHPEVVPTADVDEYFDCSERRTQRAFKVDQCLRLHVAGRTMA